MQVRPLQTRGKKKTGSTYASNLFLCLIVPDIADTRAAVKDNDIRDENSDPLLPLARDNPLLEDDVSDTATNSTQLSRSNIHHLPARQDFTTEDGSKVTMLTVFSRYFDDMQWFTELDSGIVDKSSGSPELIMPFEIYQAW
jgi:hypothetical protein